MRVGAARRTSAINNLSQVLQDEATIKRLVDSWIQIQDIFSVLPPGERRKAALELEKVGQSLTPLSGGYIWSEMGEYVKNRRRVLSISQIDLARKMGFSSQFLGRIESGKVPLPDDALKKMIRELQLDEKKISKIYVQAALDYVRAVFTASKIR